jgi:hypothetical protein
VLDILLRGYITAMKGKHVWICEVEVEIRIPEDFQVQSIVIFLKAYWHAFKLG